MIFIAISVLADDMVVPEIGTGCQILRNSSLAANSSQVCYLALLDESTSPSAIPAGMLLLLGPSPGGSDPERSPWLVPSEIAFLMVEADRK